MGIYINPGSEKYKEALRSEIYVDKTRMIQYLNSVVDTKQKYAAVSRPRRFGKTMAADMIGAYYDCSINSRGLFEKRFINPAYRPGWMKGGNKGGKLENQQLEEYNVDFQTFVGIDSNVTNGTLMPLGIRPNANDENIKESAWDKYLNHFNVLHLNMIDFLTETSDINEMLEYLEDEVTEEIREIWPDVKYGRSHSLRAVMAKLYNEIKVKFVVVIDEWDCVFRENREDIKAQKKYLNFLRDFLKDKSFIALAYMTGILPIKKYGEHSALNMFDEYSMISPKELLDYVGFTEDEIKDICQRKNVRFEGIKKWYDGYRLTNAVSDELIEDKSKVDESVYRTIDIYSPLSVVNAVRHKKLEAYWNETETGEALKEYIRRNLKLFRILKSCWKLPGIVMRSL